MEVTITLKMDDELYSVLKDVSWIEIYSPSDDGSYLAENIVADAINLLVAEYERKKGV